MEIMDVTGLKHCLDQGNKVTLLDVREPWEFDICHIPGSVNIPMSRIVNRIDELNKTAFTVVICHHGSRSYQVASFLEGNGFEKVSNLDGGVSAWAEQIDPQMA